MRPTLALATLDTLTAPHLGGHRCTNGDWYNNLVGDRTPCPVFRDLGIVREQVEGLHAQVHEAAHDDEAAMVVAMGATGYYPDWVEALDDDDRAGMLMMGRMAVEALAAHLDRDPVIEARAQAVRDRLASIGINPDQQ